MGGQSGLSELSIISWMSAFEGCPLSRVPLYCVFSYLCVSCVINLGFLAVADTAVREVKEETGVDAGKKYHTVAQGSKSFLHVFPLSPSSRVLLHPGLHPAPPSPH